MPSFSDFMKTGQNKGIRSAWPLAISGLLLSLCLIVGCCGSGGQAGGGSGGRIHLEFWNTMEGAEARIMPDLLRDFMVANPDIEVNEVSVDFYKAREKFIQGVSEGAGPDVMRADRFWLTEFVAKQLVRELGEAQIKDELADMVPIARGVITHNEKYWAIPISVDCLGLFYNKKHLAEKGVSVPKNFDEFAAAAEKLTDSNLGRYGFFIYPNGWYFEPFLFGFGGQYFAPDGSLAINSDETRKAMQFLQHLKDGLKAVPPVSLRANAYQTMMHSFGSGQVSMMFSGPWAIRSVLAGSAFKDDTSNLGISELPEGPQGSYSPTGCQTLVINKNSRSSEAALRFIKYMYSVEVQKQLSMVNFGLPARRAVFALPELKRDPYLQTFIRQLQMSRKIISSPRRGEIYAPLGDKLKAVLNGDITPEYALNDFETEWNNRR